MNREINGLFKDKIAVSVPARHAVKKSVVGRSSYIAGLSRLSAVFPAVGSAKPFLPYSYTTYNRFRIPILAVPRKNIFFFCRWLNLSLHYLQSILRGISCSCLKIFFFFCSVLLLKTLTLLTMDFSYRFLQLRENIFTSRSLRQCRCPEQ